MSRAVFASGAILIQSGDNAIDSADFTNPVQHELPLCVVFSSFKCRLSDEGVHDFAPILRRHAIEQFAKATEAFDSVGLTQQLEGDGACLLG